MARIPWAAGVALDTIAAATGFAGDRIAGAKYLCVAEPSGAMGVDHLAAMVIAVNSQDEYEQQCRWFAEEVMPHVR